MGRTYTKTEDFLSGRGQGKQIQGATDLQDFVSKLERPRRILMMVKAGPAVDAVVDQISPYLEEGDLLIDGGNSDYHDTERRVKQLESKSFGFIGMGVSGGAKGALEGPSMMPGGTKTSYEAIEGLVNKMAAQVEDGPCVTYIGPGGSRTPGENRPQRDRIRHRADPCRGLRPDEAGQGNDRCADGRRSWSMERHRGVVVISGGNHRGVSPHQGSRRWH